MIPPLFDNETSLPIEDVLPDLLDAFFTYYADNFCFLNRSYLDHLLTRGESSTFLICSMAALSSRFCNPSKFARYFRPKEDGSLREGWELQPLPRASKKPSHPTTWYPIVRRYWWDDIAIIS